MKQHIAKKQWDELDDKLQDKFINNSGIEIFAGDITELPNIGQMIEFLGDDFVDITQYPTKNGFQVRGSNRFFNLKHLCDALFEAVKYKLAQ